MPQYQGTPIPVVKKSIRWHFWDYGNAAAYFVTICCSDKQHFFGKVIGPGIMQLNECGQIADQFWRDIPLHVKDVRLGSHVIMPNHVHGIVIITKDHQTVKREFHTNDSCSTVRFANLTSNTLPCIIGSYKSAVTKESRKLNPEFKWQPRYHDHVVRDDDEYQRIANYIHRNPERWWYKYGDVL